MSRKTFKRRVAVIGMRRPESQRMALRVVKKMCFAIDRSRTIISAMILGRRVSAQDVAWLRREVFADGEVTRDAADELFAVARARMNNAPEWTELFVELITDHVVWQARPTGMVTEEQA